MFDELFAASKATLQNVDTYLSFPENQFARAGVTRLFASRNSVILGSTTTINGSAGVGKTHLALSTIRELSKKQLRLKFIISPVQKLCESMQRADERQNLAELLERMAALDLVVCEDLHWLAQSPAAQTWFLMLMDTLEQARIRILLTTRRPVGEQPLLDQKIVSRCHGGLCVGMPLPGFESRVLLFQHWFRELKLPILKPFADSARFLAEQLPLSPRSLRDAVLDLADRQTRNPCPVDVTYLRHWLVKETRSPRLSFDSIMELVAQEFGLSASEIRSRSKHQSVAVPRQCAMLLARELTGNSLEQIGDYFDRSHATVSHSLSRLHDLLPSVPALRQKIEKLRKQLQELPREDCA